MKAIYVLLIIYWTSVCAKNSVYQYKPSMSLCSGRWNPKSFIARPQKETIRLPNAVHAKNMPFPVRAKYLQTRNLAMSKEPRLTTTLKDFPNILYDEQFLGLPLYRTITKNKERQTKKTMVWQVRNGELIPQVAEIDYTNFDSNKTYVVLQTDSNVDPEMWPIHYWIGNSSSMLDSGDAASQAVILDSQLHAVIKIQRNVEGLESRSFKSLFSDQELIRNDSLKTARTDAPKIPAGGNENSERMFYITEKKAKLYFEETEVQSKNLRKLFKNDNCVILLTENGAYIFCGYVTGHRPKRAAVELAKILLRRKGLLAKGAPIITCDQNKMNELAEVQKFAKLFKEFERVGLFEEIERVRKPIFENPDEFTPYQWRRILDQTYLLKGIECFSTVIMKVYEFYDEYITREEDVFRHLKKTANHCYVIDSGCNSGLFIWMGRESSINIRLECARKAEVYLREHLDLSTRITYIDTKIVPPEYWDVQAMIRLHTI